MKKYSIPILLLAVALSGCSTGPRQPTVWMNPTTHEVVDCESVGIQEGYRNGGNNIITHAYARAAGQANCSHFREKAGWVPMD